MFPELETRQSLCLCPAEPMGVQAQLLCLGKAKRAVVAKHQYPGKVVALGLLPNRARPALVRPFDFRMGCFPFS